ncbi:hypothetical protein NPIL_237011 [Nephila pilipes]|uniref:Uncharacterized protein n=1 Tax=Nephila pilipes TaxID=299642 RepID=A0A8X6MP87_NEPPI|nr:hypothetical protein NPIL_237011 [Nephila pilipes]
MLPQKPKSSVSCPDLIFKKVVISPLKPLFPQEQKGELLKNAQSDSEISASKREESNRGNSILQRKRFEYKPGVEIFEKKRDPSGISIRHEDLHFSEERSPNKDCVEQAPNISCEETLHSENKYPKFMECNEQSCSADAGGRQSDLTPDFRNKHEQRISESQPKNDINAQGRMLLDFPTPKHPRYNQVRPQNRPRRYNRAQYTSFQYRGQVSQPRSSNHVRFGNHLSKALTCYSADQKQETVEDLYENYQTSAEKRRPMRSNIRRQRTETPNWRSRIGGLFHVMGERLRKAFSRRGQ